MMINQQVTDRQLFDRIALATTSNSLNMVPHHTNNQRNRKRRRGEVANPANTLDGLVAKRADDIGASESLYKRYLTENEAIEAPSDDQELRRLELDPDVSTRMCSICGYQGKWVSEMIRHKRVHTNERPFRCKYCSRTSKWKADLIRHVAKTHGIRVVSKYSRSKTFDTSGLLMKCKGKEENEKDTSITKDITIKTIPSHTKNIDAAKSDSFNTQKPQQLKVPLSYRCALCFFEQASLLILMNHLRSVHNTQPYECRSCGCTFVDAPMTMAHFGKSTCSKSDLKINIMPLYGTKIQQGYVQSQPSAVLNEAAKRVTQELFQRNTNSLMPEKIPNQQTSVIIRQKSDKDSFKKEDCSRVHINSPSTVITSTVTSPSLATSLNQGALQEIGKLCDNDMLIEENATTPEQVAVPRLLIPNLTAALAALKQQICIDPLTSLHTFAALAAQSSIWTTAHRPSAFSPTMTTSNTESFQKVPTRLNVIIPNAEYDSPSGSNGNSPLSVSSNSEKDCITISNLRRNALCSAFELPYLHSCTETSELPSTARNNDDDIIDVVHLDECND